MGAGYRYGHVEMLTDCLDPLFLQDCGQEAKDDAPGTHYSGPCSSVFQFDVRALSR